MTLPTPKINIFLLKNLKMITSSTSCMLHQKCWLYFNLACLLVFFTSCHVRIFSKKNNNWFLELGFGVGNFFSSRNNWALVGETNNYKGSPFYQQVCCRPVKRCIYLACSYPLRIIMQIYILTETGLSNKLGSSSYSYYCIKIYLDSIYRFLDLWEVFTKLFKMGRRSINTTKSGKYMNPTDQASKYSSVYHVLL